jgi:hypothetical protein
MTRRLVDKTLGILGLGLALTAGLVVVRSLVTLVRGPGLIRRLIGALGVGVVGSVAGAALYVAYFLLRYPAERRSSAAELEQLAARESGPLTRAWMEGEPR